MFPVITHFAALNNLSFSVLSQNWKRNLWCKFFEVYLLSRKVYAFFFFFGCAAWLVES